ncbi:hypothetical protein BBW65_05010 [Helicobacter enhydrae]|uniref:Autotransporter domain-containing protein n=1 Tax=Helicobacter enhydrae TaxID=222136 RepID=A0A1B1U613_9HELI|nr:autotransporter outer membrane beta-barrel domain-containing protein [Helicobacter enhydrae]ANV98196.1 hypothetical protein BBW65_05010 [Helicobacter enhydrae]
MEKRCDRFDLTLLKPMVASSLALALSISGVSGASADCDASSGAVICTGASEDSLSSAMENLKNNFEFKSLSTPNGFYQPNIKNGGSTPITNLTLQFSGESQVKGSGDAGSFKIQTKDTDRSLRLDTGTQGLKMGSEGKGTLVFDFTNATGSDNHTMTLNLGTGTDTGKQVSLLGNLEVKGKEKAEGDTSQDTFEATLTGGIEGNITIGESSKAYNLISNFNFIKTQDQTQDVIINGSITTKGGGVITGLTFQKSGVITGNISTDKPHAKTNITLQEDNLTLTLQGEQNQLTTFALDKKVTTKAILKLGKDGSTTTTSIAESLNAEKLTIEFLGNQSTLNLDGTNTTTLKTLKVNGTEGTFNVKSIATINEAVSVGDKKTLNLIVAGNKVTFGNKLEAKEGGTINVTLDGISGQGLLKLAGVDNKLTTLTVKENKYGHLHLTNSISKATTTFTSNAKGDNLEVTLGGNITLALEGETNKINTLKLSGDTATLKLGKDKGTSTTDITNGITGGANLTIELLGTSSTLNLGGTNNTINKLDPKAIANILNLTADSTTITEAVNVISGKYIKLNLNQANSTLTLTGGLTNGGSGTQINFNQSGTFDGTITTTNHATTITTKSNGTITKNITQSGSGKNNISFDSGTPNLTLEGSQNQINKVTIGAGATSATLKLGKASNNTTTTIKQDLSGEKLTIQLLGNEATLNLGGTNTIKALTTNATTNALNLTSGTTTITNAVSVTNKTLNINVTGTGLTFQNELKTTGGEINATLAGVDKNKGILTLANANNTLTTLSVTDKKYGKLILAGGGATTTFTGNVSGDNLEVTLGNNTTLALEGTTNNIKSLKLSGSEATLKLGKNGNTTTTIGGGINDKKELALEFLGNTSTLNLAGLYTIKSLTLNATTSKLKIGSGDEVTITGAVSVGARKTLNLEAQGDGKLTINQNLKATGGTINVTLGNSPSLTLQGTQNAIAKLTRTNEKNHNATINLSSRAANATNRGTHQYNTLTIGTLDVSTYGDYIFQLYASTKQGTLEGLDPAINDAYADRVLIEGTQSNTTITGQMITLNIDSNEASKLTEQAQKGSGIALVTVKNKTDGKKGALVTFKEEPTFTQGGQEVKIKLTDKKTNQDGGVNPSGGYTTYFLGSVKLGGADTATQKIISSALSINYDLFVANFNSINKRLGDLRGNPYTQGVWARIFAGGQESKFGIGSQSTYVTLQSGYDYAFVFEGGKTYAGVALSYARSTGKSRTIERQGSVRGAKTISLDGIKSQAFEIAIYNSYLGDTGFYNDSIAKFSTIHSDFQISDSATGSQTTNSAFLLSNEAGYRYGFGAMRDWFVTPQVEIGLGYLSASSFQAELEEGKGQTNSVSATQDAILLVRSRLGSDVGKEFKGESWGASLYVGGFYEYDVLNGGKSNISFTPTDTPTATQSYGSNGRFVLNVGGNVSVKESTRIYVDFEKSFGNQFATQWQINLGARYSFGEQVIKLKTSEENPQTEQENKAPLKIESETLEGTSDSGK